MEYINFKEVATEYVNAFQTYLKSSSYDATDEDCGNWIDPYGRLVEKTIGYGLMAAVDWWVYDASFGEKHEKFKAGKKTYYADQFNFSEFYDLVTKQEFDI